MQLEDFPSLGRAGRTPFTRAELARARYDERGIYAEGRAVELERLRDMGRRDPSLGRIYEGHFNGAQIVALYGTPEQRERAHGDVERGELFGVWNTQDADPVTIEPSGSAFVLGGAKTWASAADFVSRALITARFPNGEVQMCLVPMNRCRTEIDGSAWRPLGMQGSNSYRVAFDGVHLEAIDLIGAPGAYERPPWFLGGAIRFAAVHAGIVERVCDETIAYAVARERTGDPFVRERIGRMRIASRGAVAWLDVARDAWSAYDAEPTESRASAVVEHVDMARIAIERAALDTLEDAIRTVGAHGMVEPLPFASLFRDLHMYLRQPAPDAALTRVADAAFDRQRARR